MNLTWKRYARLGGSAFLGVGVGVLVGLSRPDLAVLVGWTSAVVGYSLWSWARVWPLTPDAVAGHARQEDPGRAATDIVLILASIASVGGVLLLLLASRSNDTLAAATAVASVVSSWLLVHTIYGFRYADLYYDTLERTGRAPIDFYDDPPNYVDFAYLTFCLGMTYQISDTTLRTRRLRREVLAHTALSYLFGAVVLAATINLVSGLGA